MYIRLRGERSSLAGGVTKASLKENRYHEYMYFPQINAGKKKKVSNATVVRREREARKAARETEVAREKAAAAVATAEENEELRQAKVWQCACEATMQEIKERQAAVQKTGLVMQWCPVQLPLPLWILRIRRCIFSSQLFQASPPVMTNDSLVMR